MLISNPTYSYKNIRTITLKTGEQWLNYPIKNATSPVDRSKITSIEIKNTVLDIEGPTYKINEEQDVSIYAVISGNKLTIFLEGFQNIKANIDSSKMFKGFNILTTIEGLKYLDFSETFNYKEMFSNCEKLTDEGLNFSSLLYSHSENVSGLEMAYMFQNCKALNESLKDVCSFIDKPINSCSFMFDGCEALETLDLNFEIFSNCSNFESMFKGCYKLDFNEELNLYFNNDQTTCIDMFNSCEKLGKNNGIINIIVKEGSQISFKSMLFNCIYIKDVNIRSTTENSFICTSIENFLSNDKEEYSQLERLCFGNMTLSTANINGYIKNAKYLKEIQLNEKLLMIRNSNNENIWNLLGKSEYAFSTYQESSKNGAVWFNSDNQPKKTTEDLFKSRYLLYSSDQKLKLNNEQPTPLLCLEVSKDEKLSTLFNSQYIITSEEDNSIKILLPRYGFTVDASNRTLTYKYSKDNNYGKNKIRRS